MTFDIYFCRIEYDAYRTDLEGANSTTPTSPPPPVATPTNGDEMQKNYTKHKENYEKLRADVAIKMQFLDENRVSEM